VHIELVDVLRCPNPHEDSWLVASIEQMEQREIVRGTLGCPVCSAEYRIDDRTVLMGGAAATSRSVGGGDPIRLAAMLDLIEPSSFVLLSGDYAPHAAGLREMLDQRVVVLDAPSNVATDIGIYGVRPPEGALPIAAGSARGIALDESHAALAARAATALRAGGRLVAPAATPLPPAMHELARDDDVWVAERVTTPQVVTLRSKG
jgi:uncharacterized protein YbaR (Trm112 family)